MTDQDHDQFEWTVRAMVDKYGPWDVLFQVTEALRPAFQSLAQQDARRPKQPRRKKPPPRICGDCNGTGYHAEDGDSDCPECGGTGYLSGTEEDR